MGQWVNNLTKFWSSNVIGGKGKLKKKNNKTSLLGGLRIILYGGVLIKLPPIGRPFLKV